MEPGSGEGEKYPSPLPDEYAQSSQSKGKFRFKSGSSHSSKRDRHDEDRARRKRHHSSSDRAHERSSRRRRHKRRRSSADEPSENGPAESRLSPGAAFRESLFDAMGDDEGAAYWESVYGQPIHTYAVPEVPKGPDGELERMTEEEYAAYVRARMWERTREGMLEEQERLREERRKLRARETRSHAQDRDRLAFERAMEDSLRRGAERKRKKAWEGIWAEYLARWEEIGKIPKDDGSSASRPLHNLLFWPVESGKRRDVAPESVQEFMRHAPSSTDLSATLKVERIRWHPDKIQHRYSALGIDETVMRSVTEVFQIVDRMWNEERERNG
ncbi:uncharacterized protein N7459_008954 [Penicillium hispanicum]|uniref:uncharacterized protein n=1 Tax=Penicillium hispanicum TaxID=1080232 RepID=UPI0025407E0F|nr:uncharacterized protein N7459_008954 [Penicillium hispanicum]KAJ5569524.1 hypothetical protein N7459_008954 [Penicillium hispanicum]